MSARDGLAKDGRAYLAERLGSAQEARWLRQAVQDDEPRLWALVERRLAGEPLQYLLGRWAFRTLELAVDPRVLIPRPETEQVVEVALAELRRLAPRSGVVVDLGTGSGAIALAIATEATDVAVWATDCSADALAVAKANADQLSLDVTFRRGSWWEALPEELRGRIDLVVSNPPYVTAEEWPDLDPEVRAEPYQALVAGPSGAGSPGLAAVEAVLRGGWEWLARPGTAVVEIAPHQAADATELARAVGYYSAEVRPDLSGRLRALVARVAAPGNEH